MSLFSRKLFRESFKQCTVILTYRTATNKSIVAKNVKSEEHTNELSEVNASLNKDDFKSGLKRTTRTLQELFNIQPFSAMEIVSKNRKLVKIPDNIFRTNFDILMKNKVTKSTIIKYPAVLCELNLHGKLEYLKKISYKNLNELVPLLTLSINSIQNLASYEVYHGRLQIMVDSLGATVQEVCESFARRPFLVLMDLDRLKTNLSVLKDYGITKDQILRDLWILNYKTDSIITRFDLAKESNVDILKTWMIRVPLDIFQKHIKKKTDHKMLLGNNSFLQYLSERLDCSEDVAKYILMKQPAIQNRNIKKLNEMIDFLFSYGYTPTHIIRSPKILLHSVQTCRKRLKELEEAGIHLDGISLLTKSTKQYTQYLDSVRNKVKSVG